MATKKSRKNPRAQVSLLARYRSPTAFEFVNEECFDLSAGGMFIKSPTPAPTGTLLKLECQVDGGAEMLRGVARVVWLREREVDGQPPGMGVKFVKLEPGTREIIHRILVERGSIIPGELEALRPSAAQIMVGAGGAVESVPPAAPAAAVSSAVHEPMSRATVPELASRATVPDSPPQDLPELFDGITELPDSMPPANGGGRAEPAAQRAPERKSNGLDADHAARRSSAPEAHAPVRRSKPSAETRPSATPAPTSRPAPPRSSNGPLFLLALALVGIVGVIVFALRNAPGPEREASPPVTVLVPEPSAETAVPAASATEPVARPAAEPQAAQSEQAAAAEPEPAAVAPPAPAAPEETPAATAASERRAARRAEERAERAAAEPAAAETAAPEAATAPAPSAEPAAAVAVAPPSEPATPPSSYVLDVVTTPEGAQISAGGQHAQSPCTLELGALDRPVEVRAELAGYSPAVASIDRIGFMLEDGRMRRRIAMSLQALPAPLPDPEEKRSRHRSSSREPASKTASKPAGSTPMQTAMQCLTTGDNECAIKALEGKARSAQELELLIETYRTLGDSAKAERWMQAYVDKYPTERRANTYRRQLERRQTEGGGAAP